MTPSSEEKEISTLLRSFPKLPMDEEKRMEIARHLRREQEMLSRLKRRSTYRKVIGGVVASFAILLLAYRFVPLTETATTPDAQHAIAGTPIAEEANKPVDKVTTIDPQIQSLVEAALGKTAAAYDPEKITVIVSDPNTGEILGMANRSRHEPNGNPADIAKAEPDPVAAFQIVTLAAAIEEGKFDPSEIYESGTYKKIPGAPIRDHNNGIGWGKITFEEGIRRSSNVAFAKLAYEHLQQHLLQEYWDRFGFGQKTGIELQSEESGALPKMTGPREVALASIGYGGSASAIQQIAAVGAIANGGELLKPHLMKKAQADSANDYKIRRVVSEETAKQVRQLLESAVSSKSGTGRAFQSDQYPVAVKTAITQKYDNDGKVIDGKYNASIIGFAPSDDPKLLIYVAVDEPKAEASVVNWSRQIIAPLFKEVMEKSLQYLEKR